MLCRLKWIYKNIDELMHAACFADELERFEQAAFECIEFLFGPVSKIHTFVNAISPFIGYRKDSDPDLMHEVCQDYLPL